jgi:hypothetical protein
VTDQSLFQPTLNNQSSQNIGQASSSRLASNDQQATISPQVPAAQATQLKQTTQDTQTTKLQISTARKLDILEEVLDDVASQRADKIQTASPKANITTSPSQALTKVRQSTTQKPAQSPLDALESLLSTVKQKKKQKIAADKKLTAKLKTPAPVTITTGLAAAQAPGSKVAATTTPPVNTAKVPPLAQAQARPGQPQAAVSPSTTPTSTSPIPAAIAQAVPTAVTQAADQADDQLATAYAGRSVKEKVDAAVSPDQALVDAGTGLGQVEVEPPVPSPEITPEVEAFLQEVKDESTLPPQEVVLADGTEELPAPAQMPSKPVIVIPITTKTEKKGKWKGPKFSVRWLVEFSRKIMKMFKGMVIYRTAEEKA